MGKPAADIKSAVSRMPKNLNVIAMAKTPAKIRRATRTAARAQVGDVDVMMACGLGYVALAPELTRELWRVSDPWL
jgi:hypothetical protein